MALTSKGKVLGWGNNDFGQLADGTTTERDSPVRTKLPPGARVTAISAGNDSGLARTASGQLLAWGGNEAGQLGDGSSGGLSDVPVGVRLPAGLTAIAIGSGPMASVSMAITRKARP